MGLERRENVDVQVDLIRRMREIRVVEDLILEIEVVNAGLKVQTNRVRLRFSIKR